MFAAHTPTKTGSFPSRASVNAGEGEEVVDEDQCDGHHKAGALAAPPGGEAERNSDQHQNQAGRRVGEPLVHFDQVGFAAGTLGVLVEHVVAHGQNGGVIAADVGIFLGANGEWKFRFQEGGNLVLGGPVVAHHVVLGAVTQAHQDGVRSTVGNHGVLCGGDFGRDRITQVGEEDALPARGSCAGADILHVQDVVLKVFIEDARLNFKRGLLIFKGALQP